MFCSSSSCWVVRVIYLFICWSQVCCVHVQRPTMTKTTTTTEKKIMCVQCKLYNIYSFEIGLSLSHLICRSFSLRWASAIFLLPIGWQPSWMLLSFLAVFKLLFFSVSCFCFIFSLLLYSTLVKSKYMVWI